MDGEGRARFGGAGEGDAALEVSLGEQLDAVGAQAPAASFRREGTLEDLELDLPRHVARIVDPELGRAVGRGAADRDDFAGPAGLQGVLDHVAQDSGEQGLVADDRDVGGLLVELENAVLAGGVPAVDRDGFLEDMP